MSQKRQDTYVPTVDWVKHLRPFGKRKQNKRERQAAKIRIRKEVKSDN